MKIDKSITPAEREEKAQQDRLRKIARYEKKLAKIVTMRGYNSLMPMAFVGTDVARLKEQKFVIECLALSLNVHPQLLAFHGLVAEINPPVPDVDVGETAF